MTVSMQKSAVAAWLLVLMPWALPAAEETEAAAESAPPTQLELDASAIRGHRELPRVMYIVPWKDPSVAELAGRPFNSLVEEVLAPLDREVFRRQLGYFEQLYADGPTGAAGLEREVDRP